MSTCNNQLDLEQLGSWPTTPKNFPGTGIDQIKSPMFSSPFKA